MGDIRCRQTLPTKHVIRHSMRADNVACVTDAHIMQLLKSRLPLKWFPRFTSVPDPAADLVPQLRLATGSTKKDIASVWASSTRILYSAAFTVVCITNACHISGLLRTAANQDFGIC
jgi:hypothetical protein